MDGLEGLFSSGQRFEVDLEHLMEGIRDIYTFEKWKIPIVENVDNFIDEKEYHTISFLTNDDTLRIEMIGTGIRPDVFNELPKIAFTTKIDEIVREKKEGLGYFGWGLKATFLVAEDIAIETRFKDFKGRQVWFWVKREPYWRSEAPCLNLEDDRTVIIYHLKDEYKGKIGENEVISTLQEFYPTLLAGAPALGRKRRFLVNGREVPKPAWLEESRYRKVEVLKGLKVCGETIGGRIFISDNDLEENLRGIALIVCGRNIINERLNLFPEVKKYTGYVHADFLFRDLRGDKTWLERFGNPRFQELKKQLTIVLTKILEECNLLPKITIKDREFMRKIYRVFSEVLSDIPELEKYGIVGPMMGKAGVYVKGDEEPVIIEEGPSSKTDIPHIGREKWVDQPGGGGIGPKVSPAEDSKERAKKVVGKRRTIPQILYTDLEDEAVEARFEGVSILVNKRHPISQYAERAEATKLYHACRAGSEAILDHLLSNKDISPEEYLNLKKKIIYKLGYVL